MSSQNEAHTSQIAATLASLTLNDAQRLTGEQIPYLGFIISKATQAIVARSDAALEPFGITSRHYGILYVISHEAGLPQKAIGDRLRIDRTTMVKLVDDLEKMGLVVREKDPNDRRAYMLSLSPLAKEKLADIDQHVLAAEAESIASLQPEEVQQLLAILLKLL